MNREIKFKCWHKRYQMLLQVIDLSISLRLVNFEIADAEYQEDFDVVEILQYTGLKDKNGKEIYESDIVSDAHTIFKIIWYKGRFDFERISGAFQYPYFGDNCSRMEIIGNIFENPDLLK